MIDPISFARLDVENLGPLVSKGGFSYNCYMFKSNGKTFLVDVPPSFHYDAWANSIKKKGLISDVDFLMIQAANMTYCGTFKQLLEDGFKGKVITTYLFGRPLLEMFPSLNLITIDELKYILIVDDNIVLKFVPLSFLPFPQMFMTYHPLSSTLFSSTMFSSFQLPPNANPDAWKSAVYDFHKTTMPSSEFLKEPLRKITHMPIQTIYPYYGISYEGKTAIDAIDNEYRLDFYNTRQVFQYDAKGKKDINFPEIVNHVVNTLLKTMDKQKVLEMFADGPIVLEPASMEVKATNIVGYPLYDAVFKHLYARGGSETLVLLEPLSNIYQTQYGLLKPSVYKAQVVDIERQKEQLEEEKRQLKQKITQLESAMAKAESALLKDVNTGLYNENFFRELMKNDLTNLPLPPYVRGFAMVRLDQLTHINQKYGKVTGDESLRHLKYHVEQIMGASDMLFKLNGPHLLLYFKETTPERLMAAAIKLRNVIASSNQFIEKVSVSSSLMHSGEIARDIVIDEAARLLLSELERRLSHAITQGGGQIGQKTIPSEEIIEGVILLIDEDDINRNMLTRIFKRINYAVVTAKDVIEANDILDKRPIDIIVSEINLAKIDGFAFKKSLNESKSYSHIPFIMVSHSKTVANIRRANLLGVDLLLEKPIIPEELLGHVQRYKARKTTKL